MYEGRYMEPIGNTKVGYLCIVTLSFIFLAPQISVAATCQDYNLTKLTGKTDNLVNINDINNFINYMNNNSCNSPFYSLFYRLALDMTLIITSLQKRVKRMVSLTSST